MRSLLAFGDSNTWGLIPGSRPQQRFPWDMRWTGILAKGMPGLRVIEEGLCGRTTVFEDGLRPDRRGLSSLPRILESQQPFDAAILMLGTNDCKSIYEATTHMIGRGIELCLDELEKYVAPSRILLISPLELGDEVFKPDKDPEFSLHSIDVSKGLRDEYLEISRKRGTAFLAASDIVRPSNVDDEHLDANGHKIFAEAVLIKLREMGV